jgi:hypothetical protein
MWQKHSFFLRSVCSIGIDVILAMYSAGCDLCNDMFMRLPPEIEKKKTTENVEI